MRHPPPNDDYAPFALREGSVRKKLSWHPSQRRLFFLEGNG